LPTTRQYQIIDHLEKHPPICLIAGSLEHQVQQGSETAKRLEKNKELPPKPI
jgi:hypothetical protein